MAVTKIKVAMLADPENLPASLQGPSAWAAPVTYDAGIEATATAPATVVTYLGATYVCTAAHTTTSTFESANWQVIVERPWAAPVEYEAAIAATVGPPATIVTYSGSTYICIEDHTTGESFDSEKWASIASAANAVTSVNLTAPAAGITVSGGPVTDSGSITLALANDLAALEALSGTGIATRTGTDTWTLDTSTYLTSADLSGYALSTALADYMLTADLASTANGDGAALIGIEDSGGLITATTVEGALAENRTAIDAIEADYLTSSDVGSTVQAYSAVLDATTASFTTADETKLDAIEALADVTDATNVAAAGALMAATEDQTISGGATVTSKSITAGSFTVDCGDRPLQYITNSGAFTITAPAADGQCTLLMTNDGSAGAVTFSGFQVGSNTGDALTTTNGDDFAIYITRVNSIAFYTIQALQ